MFGNKNAFSSFSVDDLEKARKFYSDILGIEVTEREMGNLELRTSDDHYIMVYPKPDHVPATFTVLNFPVDNIESVVDDLTKRGVNFEHYEGQLKTDDKGIFRSDEVWIAWFKDPADNILSVIEDRQA